MALIHINHFPSGPIWGIDMTEVLDVAGWERTEAQ